MLTNDMIKDPFTATLRVPSLASCARIGGHYEYRLGLWALDRIEAVACDDAGQDAAGAFAFATDPIAIAVEATTASPAAPPALDDLWLEQLVVGGVDLVCDDVHDNGLCLSTLASSGRSFADLFRAFRDVHASRWDQYTIDLFRQPSVERFWAAPILTSDARIYYRVCHRGARPASFGLRVVGRCMPFDAAEAPRG